MKIVIALGGNALGENPEKQRAMVAETAKKIVPIVEAGHDIIITHGNGPQVGMINLAFSEGSKVNSKVYEMSFVECGAMSQGYIGYYLQTAIENELRKINLKKNVVTIVTQIKVDKNDPAFLHPTKPVGSFYTKEDALKLGVPVMDDAGRGYRRAIASPKPLEVLEKDTVEKLNKEGNIVITCGGGGIPVVLENNEYVGIDAVIDKDFASSKLADDINADVLLILTGVDKVAINFKKPNQFELGEMKIDEMIAYNEAGHFPPGSMKPKVEACLDFVKGGKNRLAIITSIDKAPDEESYM